MSKWGADYTKKTENWSGREFWARDAAVALQSIAPPRTFLDFGCGTGRLLELVQEKFPTTQLLGVDPNTTSFPLARERCPKAKLFTSLSYIQSGSIDVAVVMHALPQFSFPHHEMLELWDRLKFNGQVVVIVHNVNYGRLRWLRDWWAGYKPDPTITTEFTLKSLTRFMEEVGFYVEEAFHYGGGFTKLIPFCRPRIYLKARRVQ